MIERIRKDEGITRRKARYGNFVREANRQPRVDFFSELLNSSKGMWDWGFVDESCVMLNPTASYVYVNRKDKYGHIHPTVKFPLKVRDLFRTAARLELIQVCVWLGISMRGATKVCILQKGERINAEKYVVSFFPLPFCKQCFYSRRF